jgi:hypothetical protein
MIKKLVNVDPHVVAKYRFTPVFIGNTFQDLPRVLETADNTERYTGWFRRNLQYFGKW